MQRWNRSAVALRGRPTVILAVLAGLPLLALSAGCAALGSSGSGALGPAIKLAPEFTSATGASGSARLVRTPESESVTLDEAVAELADADVVFLGELHDNALGHAVQLALTQALADQRGSIIVSMEMFERDSQPTLDLYLAGALDEDEFKGLARLWPNYDEHYRGAVELCRERGFAVLAANVYRPIAARVAKQGITAGLGDPWAAHSIHAPRNGEYRRRFNEVMGVHGDDASASDLDDIFAAQCVKDDTMAESIALALDGITVDTAAPQVIHWNGRFHSDFGLGTVERLKMRRPELNIAVVSMISRVPSSAEPLTEDELNQGHFLIVAE